MSEAASASAPAPAALHTRNARKSVGELASLLSNAFHLALLAQEINGILTDFAVTIFADRVFIVVTQLGTFGTLVR
ncbi:hypothetical protein BBJ28_00000129 [Nothophytophthora sp. Chile5]|nr:hypothetical protein BBJ28_00000129 [Nothophytophthora sp. Chile5]